MRRAAASAAHAPRMRRCWRGGGAGAGPCRKWLLLPLLCLLACFLDGAHANLNMFVDRDEIKRLTGFYGSKIHYIQEGVVNRYAMNYVVPVHANLTNIRFHWQSLIRKPMPYELDFRWNDAEAMNRPSANISDVGYVPRVEHVFSVLFPCTGRVNAIVEVDILLNITTYLPKQRFTFLKLKRRKTCLQGRPTLPNTQTQANATVRLELSGEPDLSLALGVMGAIAVTIVTLGAAMLLYVRQRKAAMSPGYAGTVSTGSRVFLKNFSKNYHTIDTMARSCSYATIASFRKLPLPDLGAGQPPSTPLMSRCGAQQPVTSLDHAGGCRTVSSLPVKLSQHYASSEISQVSYENTREPVDEQAPNVSCHIERSDLTLTDLVAEGAYGRLYHGVLSGGGAGRCRQLCLVKTVSAQATPQQSRRLLSDGLLLAGWQHPALLSPLGCCTDAGRQPCVLYPGLGTVNLKEFLVGCRPADAAGPGRPVGCQTMVEMTVQIVSGLVHVHQLGLLHGDVAARNCVVDDRLRVRLTDAALSSDIYSSEYSQLTGGSYRPIRWAAPESLVCERHSQAADVWAAAVTAWEVTSLGRLPFSELKEPLEVIVLLREGYRLAQPPTCPAEMYTVLLRCWSLEPEQRPLSRELLTWLQNFSATFDRLI